MDTKIIDGKKWAKIHEEKLKEKIRNLNKKPSGVNILIGDDPASVLYTQIKEKKAQELGLDLQTVILPTNSDFNKVVNYIQKLNQTDGPNGIMIQLPLLEEFLQGHKEEELLEQINPRKDMDGLNYARKTTSCVPAAVGATLSLLKDEGIEVVGKKVVVVGASDLVGKPAARELEKLGAKVEICDSKTGDLKGKTLTAEILVSATGVPGLITGEMVKIGVVVIDIGASSKGRSASGREKVVGDVDFSSVYPKASKITPVPGGVGPMTVVTLMENLVQLGGGNV